MNKNSIFLKAILIIFAYGLFIPAARADITTGLVGQWKLDEGSGTTAADSTGNGHTGTLTNGPTWGTGQIGQAVSFSGGSGSSPTYINVPSPASLGDFTFSTWVYINSAAHTNYAMIGDGTGNFRLMLRSSTEYMAINGVSYSIGSTASNLNTWVHVVVTRSGNTATYYRNGVLVGTWTPGAANFSFSKIGTDGTSSISNDMIGLMDEVRIYNRALSQADVTELYAYTGSGGGPGAGNLSGWAWSSTIGWISFNSSDAGAGGGPFAVSSDASGNLTGYAWASTIGWIKFGGLASFPGSGSNAQVNLSTGAVTGWARACAGTVNGDCTGATRGDGWDGWIELSGTNHATSNQAGTGGVTMNTTTGALVGYAWGGSVVGWIQFNSGGATGVTLCPSGGCAAPPITGTCTASPNPPTNLAPNTSVTFTATPTSGIAPYTYNWDGAGYAGANTKVVSYSSTGSGPSVIIKDNAGSVTAAIGCPSVTILQPLGSSNLGIGRTVATAVSPAVSLNQNSAFALKWNATLTDDYSCSPSISPDPGNANWTTNWSGISLNGVDNGDGTKTWSGDTSTNLNVGTVATGAYNFVMTCTSATNSTQASSATLHVVKTSVNEF